MKGTMRCLKKLRPEPGLWMDQAEIPTPGPTDVLIKVHRSAICGSDLHIYNWDKWSQQNIKTPMITGHEFAGEIVSMGDQVRGYQLGQRVSAEGHITCGVCRNCRAGTRHLCRNTVGIGINRDGSFAEYVSVPAFNVFPLPDSISYEQGALFDPYGNAVHTACSYNLVGEDVLITGAGPIGVMAAAICKHVGARHVVITDVNDYRLNLAKQLGATRVVNVVREGLTQVMQELGMTEGFDVGLEMSGNAQAFGDMLGHMNHGGKIALLGIFPEGITVDWNTITFRGLHIKGIYGREMFETWYKMSSMLQSGLNIDPVISHRLPIDEFEQGFAAMNSGESGKVILEWPV